MSVERMKEAGALAGSVCEEALRLVYGDREDAYGHPAQDFARIALVWQAVLQVPITAHQVGLCLAGMKLVREAIKPRRDNRVDLAGYAETLERLVSFNQ